MTVDAVEEKIYFMEWSNTFIRRMDLDGRNVEEVLENDRLRRRGLQSLGEGPDEVVIDTVDKKVYWLTTESDPETELTTLSTIRRMNLYGTGAIEEIISMENRFIFLISLDEEDRRLYWLEDEETDDSLFGFITTIRSTNLDGGDIKDHVTGIEASMNGFDIDPVKAQVYWIAVIDDEAGTSFHTIRRAGLGNVDVSADGGEIVIDIGTNPSFNLVLDEKNRMIYWLKEQYVLEEDEFVLTVQRARIDDAAPSAETVVQTQSAFLNYVALSSDLGKLYWTESKQLPTRDFIGSVWRVSLSGTEAPKDLTHIDFPSGIAVDTKNENLYWTVPELGIIRGANLDGTNQIDVITGLNQPQGFVIDPVDEQIYWAEGPRDDIAVWHIRRANLDGTEEEEFFALDDALEIRGLAIDVRNQTIYWTSTRELFDGSNDEVIAAQNTDATGLRIVAKDLNRPLGIAIDSMNRQMYWTEPGEGTIKRSNLDGTRQRLFVSGLVNPQGIAVDPQRKKIYWTSREEGGEIGKIQWANLDGTQVEDVIINLNPSVKYIALGLPGVRVPSIYPTGDVNGDFEVNAFDAALILQFAVGLIDRFPIDELLSLAPENAVLRHYEVSLPEIAAKSGERVTIPIAINDATGFLAGGVVLKYDPTVLKAAKAYLGLNGAYWKANTDISGEVRVAFASFEDTLASDTLFVVEFEVLSDTYGKESPLTLDYVSLSNSLSIQKNDGLLTILPYLW